MKAKDIKGLLGERDMRNEASITLNGIKRNKLLTEIGEKDVTDAFEKWAKENGWVKFSGKYGEWEIPQGLQDVVVKHIIKKCGYIKLDELELDVEKIGWAIKHYVDSLTAQAVAQAINQNLKNLIKVKEKPVRQDIGSEDELKADWDGNCLK